MLNQLKKGRKRVKHIENKIYINLKLTNKKPAGFQISSVPVKTIEKLPGHGRFYYSTTQRVLTLVFDKEF